MKRTTLYNLILIFLLIPGTLFLGTRLTGRWYYLTSTLIIIETMISFFLAFESRKPQARINGSVTPVTGITATVIPIF